MRYSFHPEAKTELTIAVKYYESRKLLLGRQFATEVSLGIQRIVAHPTMWPFIRPGVRRCLLHRFPFGIIYHIDEENNHLFILAVMHLHRNPGYWSDRFR
jgi:plasmid stabilization system protein ParE